MNKSLIEEFFDYDPYNWRNRKAKRIYYKCLEVGKKRLARRIFALYTYPDSKISDRVIAMQMSLLINK